MNIRQNKQKDQLETEGNEKPLFSSQTLSPLLRLTLHPNEDRNVFP